jgi:4-amino-4-deoxychorismate lyase
MLSRMKSLTLINSVESDLISCKDRGLAYGDGLFETIKILKGNPCLLAYHQERLRQGLNRLGFSQQAITTVEAHLTASIEAAIQFAINLDSACCVMKWIVTRGEGVRGYNSSGADHPTVIVSVAPYVTDLAKQKQGVRVFDCNTPLARNPFLSGLKHLNRLEQVLARSEWDGEEYAEGLMLDTAGNLIEGTMSNLFWVNAGVVYTPDLSQSGIEGTLRRFIIQSLSETGQTVQIVTLGINALKEADEVFVCNSLIGVWPVVQFLDCHWDVGSITLDIQKRLDEAEV